MKKPNETKQKSIIQKPKKIISFIYYARYIKRMMMKNRKEKKNSFRVNFWHHTYAMDHICVCVSEREKKNNQKKKPSKHTHIKTHYKVHQLINETKKKISRKKKTKNQRRL